jgi:hypothetical protein
MTQTEKKLEAIRAAVTYATIQKDVDSLLVLIADATKAHAAEAVKAPAMWGHIGDMEHCRKELVNVLAGFTYAKFDGNETATRLAIETRLEGMRDK